MNIFFNISHPAHVHFFRNTIANLKKRNHNIIVGARKKDITLQLLDQYGIDYILLTKKGSGALSLLLELMTQQLKLAHIIQKYKIDLMVQLCGIFNAPIGKLMNIPTIALSDTEIAKIDNSISFPLSTHVFLTSCFDHSIGGSWKKQVHYPGYHELAYLSPKYFKPEKEIEKIEKRFLVRFVSWEAAHDIGEEGLTLEQKLILIKILKKYGKVYISSESPLPDSLKQYAFSLPFSEVHQFMANCDLVLGESATMASEAACLGVPAIYISNTERGYTTEQDKKYGIIKYFKVHQWEEILKSAELWASSDLREEWKEKRAAMLRDKIEVTDWLTDFINHYPQDIKTSYSFEKYVIKRFT
ncbi:conserved hypothetical protein [Desulfamplus magnetovallimortis]|uniref:DUF354 domain-containing protein n=1 Tax=Desulfamplus magnetovallimortis TaxID=1246637 RepID=A0A1W1HLA8_9BACT|nr:DUF354 domain-containing protein [Desulfamplus magnetovallimortis]SLM33152.1 conserved hypothetical protein [Desulfamplus magnetovallimortis]